MWPRLYWKLIAAYEIRRRQPGSPNAAENYRKRKHSTGSNPWRIFIVRMTIVLNELIFLHSFFFAFAVQDRRTTPLKFLRKSWSLATEQKKGANWSAKTMQLYKTAEYGSFSEIEQPLEVTPGGTTQDLVLYYLGWAGLLQRQGACAPLVKWEQLGFVLHRR